MRSLTTTIAFRAALAGVLLGASATLTAQVSCFEPNFGTSIGTGDDVVLPTQPIGFAFPFAGTTYSHMSVCTNGFLYLSNNGVPAPGGSNCCNVTVGQFVLQPSIRPFWDDLVADPLNNGAVFVNQLTGPTRTAITWANAVEFGGATTFTIQCQLYATGEIVMYYSASTVTNNPSIVGCSPASTSPPPAVDLSTSPATASPTVYEVFNGILTPNAFDLAGRSIVFHPNPAGGYNVDANSCIGASNIEYGFGCNRNFVSFYEDFGLHPLDLANSSILLQPIGPAGYVVIPGSNGFFTPIAGDMALQDDDISAGQLLPFTLSCPGGISTNHIQVCADGYILLQDGPASPGIGEYIAQVSALLGEQPRLCPAWHDWRTGSAPGAGGLGTIHFDVDPSNTAVYVTWNGVGEFNGTLTPSTFQVAIFASGQIEFRYGNINYLDPLAEGTIVGFSQGFGALDPANRDLSATMPFTTSAADGPLPLALHASPAPVLGSSVTLTTDAIPATALLSANVLSFGQVSPGVDLGVIGAPGCLQLLAIAGSSTLPEFGNPTASVTLNIPVAPIWVGVTLYSQAASLVPGVNSLGLLTSNGVRMLLNPF